MKNGCCLGCLGVVVVGAIIAWLLFGNIREHWDELNPEAAQALKDEHAIFLAEVNQLAHQSNNLEEFTQGFAVLSKPLNLIYADIGKDDIKTTLFQTHQHTGNSSEFIFNGYGKGTEGLGDHKLEYEILSYSVDLDYMEEYQLHFQITPTENVE